MLLIDNICLNIIFVWLMIYYNFVKISRTLF